MKFEFIKLFCLPSKTDFGSDEEWATMPANDFVALQLTSETECQRKCVLKVPLDYFDYSIFF